MKRNLEDIRSNMDFVGCDNATALEMLDEIERLRAALATIRDDLSSVTVTGEEIHNIVGAINGTLNQQRTNND